MILQLILIFLFSSETDSVLQSIDLQIQYGNYSYANILADRELKSTESSQLQFQKYKNVFENFESHKKFNTFILSDTERTPSTYSTIKNVEKNITRLKNDSVTALYNYHLYGYLYELPTLTKVEKKKKSIIDMLKKNAKKSQNSIEYLFRLCVQNGWYKAARKWYKRLDTTRKAKYEFERLIFRTNGFKHRKSEDILLKALQQFDSNDDLAAKINYELSKLLFNSKELDRSDYYFQNMDSTLIDPYELYKLNILRENKGVEEIDFKFIVKNFGHEKKVYTFIDSKISVGLSNKKQLKLLKPLLKKNKGAFAQLHLNYMIYKVYKKMKYSRKRNKSVNFYSANCYKILDKLYSIK